MSDVPPPEPSDYGIGYADAYEAARDGLDLDEWVAGILARVRDEKALRESA